MIAYYNEWERYSATWTRNLIAGGKIAPGHVDDRDIKDVRPEDLGGYGQCHFFAGIGTWSYALRCAGWEDEREVWTGSCPCQPFSLAGRRGGTDDARHLWPEWFRLIRECEPGVIFGEQVASDLAWLDVVSSDLESAGYAIGAFDLCAASVGAPHIRQRLYFVAVSSGERRRRRGVESKDLQVERHGATSIHAECNDNRPQPTNNEINRSANWISERIEFWKDIEWLPCTDGRKRPTLAHLQLMADGPATRMVTVRTLERKIKYADSKKNRSDKVLQELRKTLDEKAIQRRIGRFDSIQKKALLRQKLYGRRYGRSYKSAKSKERLPTVEQNGKDEMRKVQSIRQTSLCTSQRRKPDKQRIVEFADFVRLLPSSITLAKLEHDEWTERGMLTLLKACTPKGTMLDTSDQIQEVWRSLDEKNKKWVYLGACESGFVKASLSPLSSRKDWDRVRMLRAIGNAIVAPLATAFIKAYLNG